MPNLVFLWALAPRLANAPFVESRDLNCSGASPNIGTDARASHHSGDQGTNKDKKLFRIVQRGSKFIFVFVAFSGQNATRKAPDSPRIIPGQSHENVVYVSSCLFISALFTPAPPPKAASALTKQKG